MSDSFSMETRFAKGFNFEQEVLKSLLNLPFESSDINPIHNHEAWLHNIGNGCDIKDFATKGLRFNIECKYLETNRVYPSYIWRDYISRFKGRSGYCIIVTNNKWNVPYDCRRLLQEYGIKVWNQEELAWNITTLTNKHLNVLKETNDNDRFTDWSSEREPSAITGKADFGWRNEPKHLFVGSLSQETIDHGRLEPEVYWGSINNG